MCSDTCNFRFGFGGISFMARKKSARSQLYSAARDLGNVEAASKGPASFGKRYARRKVYAKTNGFTRKLLRSFGLSK